MVAQFSVRYACPLNMHQRQIVLPTSFGGKSWMLRFRIERNPQLGYISLLEEGLREVTLTSIRLSLRRVTKIHHDVFICYYFFSAPFDTFPPWRRTTQGTASKQKVLVTTSEKLRLKSWIPLKSRRKVYDLACLNWLHSNYSKWQNPISKFFPWYFA